MIKLQSSVVRCTAIALCGVAGAALAAEQQSGSAASKPQQSAQQTGGYESSTQRSSSQSSAQQSAGQHSAGQHSSEQHAAGMQSEERAQKLTNETFVTKAAQSSLAEVELSRLALQQSQDQAVRDFAQRMIQDHQKANAELKKVAQQHQLQVPAQLDAKHQKMMQKMKGQSGKAFDAAYSQAMAKDHDKAVELFRSASMAPEVHADLQAFAAKQLPTLQAHHRLAYQLPAAEKRAAQAQ